MANRSRKRTVELEFVVDDRQLEGGLRRVEGRITKTGRSFSDFATGVQFAMSAVAGSAVLAFVGQMNELAVKAESTERRAATVFGALAREAEEWADRNNEAFGVAKNDLLEMAAATQDLLVPLGFSRQQAFDMTQTILETSNALSEWTGGSISAADAADRLRKAILGEREGLKELGVKISEADVKQRLLEKGQGDLTGAALEQAKAQATLELILERSRDALDAYTRAGDSALRKQKELTAQAKDMEQALALVVKEAIEPVIEDAGMWGESLQLIGEAMEETGLVADDTKGFWSGLTDAVLDSIPIYGDLRDVQADMNETLREQLDRVDAAQEEWAELADEFSGMPSEAELAADAMRRAAEAAEAQQEASRKAKEELQRLRDEVQTIPDVMKELAEKMIEGEGPFAKFVRDARELRDEILRLKALGEKGVYAGIGARTGGRPGGVSGVRAHGGPTFARSAYIVGERGPEIWSDLRAGRIVADPPTVEQVEPIVVNVTLDSETIATALVDRERGLG